MSIRASLLGFIMKLTVKKQFDALDGTVEAVTAFRETMANSAQLSGAIPDKVSSTSQKLNGVPCEWVTVEGIDQNRVLVYLHGGGYAVGGPDSHRDIAWRLSEAGGMRVLMVDYRLAPEDPFPAAVDDATNCYRWLVNEGFDPERIAIGGDSAGGGLAAALLVNLKNLGLPRPGCAILLSPWTDLSVSGESVKSNAKADVVLTERALVTMADHYLGERDRKAPLASPLFADLAGLPPILVQVGSTEILFSDSEAFVKKVKTAGGKVTLEIFPKMPHVFQVFAARIPEGRDAIKKLGQFLLDNA